LVEAALLAEPSNRNAWYVLVDITNAAKDWRRLARNLTRSGEALGIELDPALSEDFDEFRATPEYRRWKKDRERAKRRH
jgi:hypothetical protein